MQIKRSIDELLHRSSSSSKARYILRMATLLGVFCCYMGTAQEGGGGYNLYKVARTTVLLLLL